MLVPDDLRYSSDHEWVRLTGTVARVGITDYAQDALGDVVFIQLPDVGAALTSGDSCSEVESTKSVSDIYAPLAGTVVAVNPRLADQPELVNTDPYGDGWLFEVTINESGSPAESMTELMDAASYRALTES